MGYFFSLLPLKYNIMTLKCFISLSSLHKWVPKFLFRFTPEYPTLNFRDPLMFGNPSVVYVQGAKLSFRLLDFRVHLGQGGLNNEKIWSSTLSAVRLYSCSLPYSYSVKLCFIISSAKIVEHTRNTCLLRKMHSKQIIKPLLLSLQLSSKCCKSISFQSRIVIQTKVGVERQKDIFPYILALNSARTNSALWCRSPV